jgi:hypothetical protein
MIFLKHTALAASHRTKPMLIGMGVVVSIVIFESEAPRSKVFCASGVSALSAKVSCEGYPVAD